MSPLRLPLAFLTPSCPFLSPSSTASRSSCRLSTSTSPFFSTPLPSPAVSLPLFRTPKACLPGTGIYSPSTPKSSVRVVIFGATGYIGRFVVAEFARQGYPVVAFIRPRSGVKGKDDLAAVRASFPENVDIVAGDVTDPTSVAAAFASDKSWESTVVVSCLASRTGGIADSNAIDYGASLNAMRAGRDAGAGHYVLLSAICVQKPLLEFQRAKLRLEEELAREAAESDDGFGYSIVRPTAFFKSLAAQVGRQRKGGSYIMFGDGALSKCNALSEADLARFMVLCAQEEGKRNKVLPVGGPGEAVTPKEQAEMVFKAAGKKAKFTSVPIGVMDAAIAVLDGLAKVIPADGVKDAAEFGKIGRYYATEDMIGPQFGEDTLEAFFTAAVADGGMEGQDLGDANYF